MKKNLIALAVTAAIASPLAVQAEDVTTSVSGFVDIIYTNSTTYRADTTGGSPDNTKKALTDTVGSFGADGEIDVQATKGAVTVRADVDLTLATDSGSTGNDSGRIEQAFFAWGAMDALTVIGGVFNNPVGQELEDAPDMEFTSHSAIWNILNHQTALNGNNVAGIAAAGSTDMFTGTLAVLNNIGAQKEGGAKSIADKLSIAAVLNVNPMDGLALELGYVTQDEQKTTANVAQTAGNVLDVNAQYDIAGFTVGLDYLMADKIIDNSYNLWAGFAINDKAAIKARYEAVDLEAKNTDTITKYTVYGTYTINDNLSAALEYNQGDLGNNGKAYSGTSLVQNVTGIIDDSTITLEFIGTF